MNILTGHAGAAKLEFLGTKVEPRLGGDKSEKEAPGHRPGPYGLVHAVPVIPAAAVDHWLFEGAYRFFEVTVALVLLVALLPIMLLEALLIRLDSPGSPLFCQPRVANSAMMPASSLAGSSGLHIPLGGYTPDTLYYVPRTFRFLKFRTMFHDAKQRFPKLYECQLDPTIFHEERFKTDLDPRVTRLGLFLRRLTLDELPNLWCVVAGTMRLVGPRPELPELLQNYSAADMYKFSVKPGVTGLAQINGRGLLSWGETLAWDLQYVRTRTVRLDLKILLVTVWYVAVRRGAF